MEWIFTGYCRTQDQARTVMAELEDGELDVGCDFPNCAYAADCPIGKQLQEVEK